MPEDSWEQHPPLNHAQQQIRLLTFNDLGDLDLKVFDLRDCPKFVALSYTWGDICLGTRHILLNDRPFEVRLNLSNALEAIWDGVVSDAYPVSRNNMATILCRQKIFGERLSSHEAYFWIDSICIKQTDVVERNHQVHMMRQIYSSACAVLVWLGGDIAMASAFEYIAMGKDSAGQDAWKVLPFFQSAYWSRIWVIQEFLLARELYFLATHTGPNLIHFPHREAFLERCLANVQQNKLNFQNNQRLAGNTHFREPIEGDFSNVVRILNEKTHVRLAGRPLSPGVLAELVLAFSDANCADPRDRVYALLGLTVSEFLSANTGNSPTVEADYSISSMELYQKLQQYFPRYMHPCLARLEEHLCTTEANQ